MMLRKLKRSRRSILVLILAGSLAFILLRFPTFHTADASSLSTGIHLMSLCLRVLSQRADLSGDERVTYKAEEYFHSSLLAKCRQYQTPESRKHDGPKQNITNPANQHKGSNTTSGKSNNRIRRVIKVVRKRKSGINGTRSNNILKTYNETWYKDFENGNVQAHILKKHNTSGTRDDLTNKLWKFYDASSERLFLYSKLLENPWRPNYSNLKLIRDELHEAGFDSDEELVVTKQNTPLNSTLRYYFNPRKLPNGTLHYYDDYRVSKDFWNRLPDAPHFKRRGKPYGRCAVVGNSGILLDSRCGKEIDTYDMIFRCNAAPIAKFAEDAGWRTNLTSFNPSIFNKRYNGLKTSTSRKQFHSDVTEFKGHLWFPCFGSPSMNPMCMKPFMSNDTKRKTEPEYALGHPHHFDSLWTFWKDRNITKIPSTGFYFTHTALQLCEETHLYGFWPFPVRIDSRSHLVPYHYFDYVLVSSGHGMNDEFSIYMQYHQMGVLRVHHGECKYT